MMAAARVWSCCRFGWVPRYRSFRWPLATTQNSPPNRGNLKTLHRAPRHRYPLAVQLAPYLAGAVHPIVLFVHPPDHLRQLGVPAGTSRTPLRLALPTLVLVVGGRGDRQLFTDRLDPIRVAVLVHKRGYRLGRRSSSAWAK